jgi:hypothetical protein
VIILSEQSRDSSRRVPVNASDTDKARVSQACHFARGQAKVGRIVDFSKILAVNEDSARYRESVAPEVRVTRKVGGRDRKGFRFAHVLQSDFEGVQDYKMARGDVV